MNEFTLPFKMSEVGAHGKPLRLRDIPQVSPAPFDELIAIYFVHVTFDSARPGRCRRRGATISVFRIMK